MGIRIPVSGMRIHCPRPLDDGAVPAYFTRKADFEQTQLSA